MVLENDNVTSEEDSNDEKEYTPSEELEKKLASAYLEGDSDE